jgi:hypothetical protein
MSLRIVAATVIVSAIACSASVLAFAQKKSKSWKSSAPGMVSGSYEGGDSAYIHLSGFRHGGSYAVTKRGNVASGTTANGTKFTCRLS